MIGSFLTRGLVMIFGYAYPAYECFKIVEKNKPEIEQLQFWCQYWILVAVLTVCERIGDTFISWLPMYSEAKLAFYIYLWLPKTKGTTYVYNSFFKPYVAKHETEIDRNLMELRTRAGDMVVLYCQKAVSYGHTRFFEILQYVASQSTPTARPQNQTQQQVPKATRQPAKTPNRQAPAKPKPQVEEPVSPTSSTSSQHQKEIEQELSSSPVPSAAAPAAVAQNSPRRLKSAPTNSTQLTKTIQMSNRDSTNHSAVKKTTSEPLNTAGQSAKTTVDDMQIEPVPSQQDKANSAPPPQETVLEEAIRVTRARLRKARSTTK